MCNPGYTPDCTTVTRGNSLNAGSAITTKTKQANVEAERVSVSCSCLRA